MSKGITRRELLRLTGATAAMVPLLQSAPSEAAPPSGLRRMVIMCWPNGVNSEQFWPSTMSGDYYGPLSGIANFPSVLKPIKDRNLLNEVLVPRGVVNSASTDDPRAPGGHECYFNLLPAIPTVSGSAGGPSIDQYIASRLPGLTAFQSLQFGVFSYAHPSSCASWRGIDAPLASEHRPAQMFDALFGSGTGQEQQLLSRRRKLSILDAVFRDLNRQSQRLGSDDKRRLADHLEAVRQLEKQLDPANLPDPMCTAGVTRKTPQLDPGLWDQQYLAVHAAQYEMLCIALKCGLTQVATYQFMDAHMEYFTLNPGSPLANELNTKGFLANALTTSMHGHYDIAHGGSNAGETAKYNVKNALDAWHVDKFAQLVEDLSKIPEGTGTLLQNTVVVLINQFNNGGSHFSLPSPLLLAGGDFFKPGQVVDCKGQPLNNLFVSLCNAMGMTEVSVFNGDKYGRGPLKGAVR